MLIEDIIQIENRIQPKLIAHIMVLTGFRFSKDYRWGTTKYHEIVYAFVDVVGLNIRADYIVKRKVARLEHKINSIRTRKMIGKSAENEAN